MEWSSTLLTCKHWCIVEPDGFADVRVEIVSVVVVVAAKVVLHSVAAVDEEVIVGMVVSAACDVVTKIAHISINERRAFVICYRDVAVRPSETPPFNKLPAGQCYLITIVIVNVFLRRIIVNEKVVVNLSPLHDHVRLAGTHGSQERLTVPRVERAVVARLSAGGENQVVSNLIPSTEAVVGVDAGTGPAIRVCNRTSA